MLSKCVQCGFYVRQNDEFCPNCGGFEPTKNYDLKPQKYIRLLSLLRSMDFRVVFSVFVAFCVLMILSDFSFFSVFYFQWYIYFFALILGALTSFSLSFWLKKFLIVENISREKTTKCLSTQEKIVLKRIKTLEQRANQIENILQRIGESSKKTLSDVRTKLISANEIVVSQLSRYELQNYKIKLVRLQNNMSPYFLYLHRLDEFRIEEGILTGEQTIREVGKIRESISDSFPKKVEIERADFLKNLDETSQSCEKLWEALLSKQALFALKDVQPTNEIGTILHAEELAHATETFNLQAKLTDFSESFDELEDEYKRLTADDEITQKFLTE